MQWSHFCDSLNMYTVFFVTHLGFDADIFQRQNSLKTKYLTVRMSKVKSSILSFFQNNNNDNKNNMQCIT